MKLTELFITICGTIGVLYFKVNSCSSVSLLTGRSLTLNGLVSFRTSLKGRGYSSVFFKPENKLVLL